jgi:hypothetical protein
MLNGKVSWLQWHSGHDGKIICTPTGNQILILWLSSLLLKTTLVSMAVMLLLPEVNNVTIVVSLDMMVQE